jgi:hypothetical protein
LRAEFAPVQNLANYDLYRRSAESSCAARTP